MKSLVAFCVVVLLGVHSCEGERAFNRGDYHNAMKEYRLAAGEGGSGEAWLNLAMASLEAGAFNECEMAAERAGVVGGMEWRARRDYMIGLSLSERFAAAEMLASLPEAGAPEMDRALDLVSHAIWSFEQASIQRGVWPAAARNIERLWVRANVLEDLRGKRRKQQGRSGPTKPVRPRPRPQGIKRSEPVAKINEARLTAAELSGLRERLAALHGQKMSLRRRVHESRPAAGGRDW